MAVRDGFVVYVRRDGNGRTAMSDATTTDTGASEQQAADGEQQQQEQPKTFTQAEVDAIVKQRAERIARDRYADYDELKSKAGQTATAEERLAHLEKELTSTRTEAVRSKVAARFGISTEPGSDGSPSDVELFLTGSDEDTLTAQAQRLAARVAAVKKQGNVAPKEGETKSTGSGDQETRQYARNLFAGSD